MKHRITEKHCVASLLVLPLLLVGVAMPATASHTCWVPYTYVQQNVAPFFSALLGADGYHHRLDDPTEDNVVWNESNVFYTHPRGESFFDQYSPGTTESALEIHNPTSVDYTDAASYVTISLWDVNTGARITQTSGVVNTSPSPAWIWWDSTPGAECFKVSIPSLVTRTVDQSYLYASGIVKSAIVRVHSPYTDATGGGLIHASWSHRFVWRHRISRGGDESDFYPLPYYCRQGANMPSEDLFDGITSPMLVLPYWRDENSTERCTTYIQIANVDDCDLDVTVAIYTLDGTLINSYTFDDVEPHSGCGFLPSQLLDTGDPREGYMEVTNVKSASPTETGKTLGMANRLSFSLAYLNFGTATAGFQAHITTYIFDVQEQ